jgi:hypothetical protein
MVKLPDDRRAVSIGFCTRCLLGLLLLVAWWRSAPVMATVGLAEWEVQTPGTNIVCHSDPFIATHGTCLRPSDQHPGGSGETVWVGHIEWWQYFQGYVVGKAQRGFFVFDEATRKVTFHETEVLWQKRMKELSLVTPLTRRILPEDGWKLSWAPVMRHQIGEKRKSAAYLAMSAADRAAMEEEFRKFQEPDLRPTPPATPAPPVQKAP